jgi:catechol 2,3-dioxygenase-like lactoylglutathione lyase family enzyme
MAISQVQLFSVPVSDQDAALAFYVDALGFSLVNDAPLGPDMRWVLIAPPGGGAAIALVTWFPSMPAGSTQGIVITTDALEDDIALLRSRGVTIAGDIESAPWGRWVTFADPDGNGLILQQNA